MTARAALASLLLMPLACGDDASGSGGTGGSGTTSAATTTAATGTGGGPPADSCTQPGDMGNELGVGEYCTPLGGQCMDNSIAQFCLADVGQTEWMCTKVGCDEMFDCGQGAGCLITESGSACVPCACTDEGIGCGGTTSNASSSGASGSTASASSSTGGG